MERRNVLAKMGRKKKFGSRYIVLVGCPVCNHEMVLAFRGWAAFRCQGECPDTYLYRSEKHLQEANSRSSK